MVNFGGGATCLQRRKRYFSNYAGNAQWGDVFSLDANVSAIRDHAAASETCLLLASNRLAATVRDAFLEIASLRASTSLQGSESTIGEGEENMKVKEHDYVEIT